MLNNFEKSFEEALAFEIHQFRVALAQRLCMSRGYRLSAEDCLALVSENPENLSQLLARAREIDAERRGFFAVLKRLFSRWNAR